jgi:hypothetical protein
MTYNMLVLYRLEKLPELLQKSLDMGGRFNYFYGTEIPMWCVSIFFPMFCYFFHNTVRTEFLTDVF